MRLVSDDVTVTNDPLYDDHESAPAPATPRSAHLPNLINYGGVAAPAAPATAEESGIDFSVLCDLALKLANGVPRLSTEWAAEQLRLPHGLVERIFWQLREDQLMEILGQSGPMSYRYTITQRGRDFARR